MNPIFPIALVAGVAALVFSGNKSSEGKTDIKPVPNNPVTCDQMLDALPPQFKSAILTASATGPNVASNLLMIADGLDAASFHNEAKCLRDKVANIKPPVVTQIPPVVTKPPVGTLPPIPADKIKNCDVYLSSLPDLPPGFGLKTIAKQAISHAGYDELTQLANTVRGQYPDAAHCIDLIAEAKKKDAGGGGTVPAGYVKYFRYYNKEKGQYFNTQAPVLLNSTDGGRTFTDNQSGLFYELETCFISNDGGATVYQIVDCF